MDPASHRIQAKLEFGLLPTADPVKTWLSRGRGSYCNGCDVDLLPGQAEVEVTFVDGESLRFHETCAEIWLVLKGDLIREAAADLERHDRPPAALPRPVRPHPLSSAS
jgi:hypothetical protein